jgi:hypothetical protein
MNDLQPSAGRPGDALQFETAEHLATPSALSCTICKRPIDAVYHQAGGQVVCSSCRAQLESPPKGNLLLAILYGLGAATGTAVVGGLILKATGFFIVAAVVGYFVGRAVLKGAGTVGSLRYQLIAVFITYMGTVATFIPAIAGSMDDTVGAARWIGAVIVAPALPFYMITESPFTLIIIGLSLWEAWRVTKRPDFAFTGPHSVAPVAPPAEPSEPALA